MKYTRIEDYNKVLPIIEIYPCLQGEGKYEGRPVIAIRTTGCTHRCYFNEGGWCDTWYSSIHAIKGKYNFNDFIKVSKEHPHITEIMITGGSPTMHPNLINEIMHFANENNMFVTLETEGSHFIKTDFPINLISISPKFSNTIPRLGSKTPQGSIVTDKLISQHNKYRIRNNSISKMISYHKDYQIKPVWDGSLIVLKELKDFLKNHRIANNKVYIMPAGQTRQQLILMYPIVMEMCIKEGFNFTGRTHIIAYDDKREV